MQNLGRKHAVDYKVPDSSYDTVGEALLWTLGKGLGDDFTPDVKEAWALTYSTLAKVMTEAAAEATEVPEKPKSWISRLFPFLDKASV